MRFLTNPLGTASFDYRQLSEDLIRGSAGIVPECATTTLYAELVTWLGQIVRNRSRVVWPKGIPPHDLMDDRESLGSDNVVRLRDSFPRDATCSLDDWRDLFLNSTSRILLETSGSSGTPKQVWHAMSTLTRGIRLSSNHRTSIWGLTYPTDHLAGMQVLFQALLNGNGLIHLFRSPASQVHRALEDFSISHISCTPTFLRMLLADEQVHSTVRRLTTGGERLDAQMLDRISRMFPSARLTNIYASTEVGSLLVSHDDGFVIPQHLHDKVQLIDGELWLHQSLKIDPDTASSRPTDQEYQEFWPTGDQVEVVSQEPWKIRFLSRCHEGFNVAGYRVDPVRLEAIAREHPSVSDARFYGIPNSVTEHLVACDLVAVDGCQPLDSADWQSWLRPQVARHEVPRIVRWVSTIDTTNSGKVRRQ